jgi:hypothetical protein
MKTWFTSLNTAIMLSAIAWLTQLWRAWLDMLFEYPAGSVHAEIDGGSTIALTLIYTAVFAGWAYSMHSATRGSRGALIATLVLNTLIWLAIPVGWIAAYCTGDCPASAGILFNIANWLNLIFGLLAAVVLMLHLRSKKVAANMEAMQVQN